MKKFAILSIMALLLAGCSDREPMAENGTDTSSETSFLSVSIVASGAGTRTITDMENGDYKDDNNTDDTTDDGYYRDGTVAESSVNEVLFLFFDDKGEPVEGIYNGDSNDKNYVSYYLWQADDSSLGNGNLHDETVEKALQKHVIKMRFPRKNNTFVKPTQIFAVVNPTATHKTNLINKSLSGLTEFVENYEFDENDSYAKLSTEGKFVMTNSVYVDKDGKEVYTTVIEEENYQSTEQLAADNPVIIYVERILARIDLKIDIKKANDKENIKRIAKGEGDDAYYIYYTGVDFPDDVQVESEDKGIYVHFLGWNVFDTPSKSRLIKSINKNWDDDILGASTPWSVYQYHRSFWAINPPASSFTYKRGAFKTDEGENSKDDVETWVASANKIKPDGYVTAYFQENAAPDEPDAKTTDKTYGETFADYVQGAPVQPSKVILAAQLVDANGTPRELVKYGGKYYCMWESFKIEICNMLNLYYMSTSTDNKNNTYTDYIHIRPEHLDYTSVENAKKHTVRITLSDTAKSLSWYTGTAADNMQSVQDVENYINEKLGENSVRIWSEGYTYFYFPIRHLGETNDSRGYYGIVRNHIYDATVTSIKGLGNPVPNFKDVIEPTPDDDTGILAAEVRILSWRLVSQSYDLNW